MDPIHVLYLEDNTDHVSLVSDCLQVQFPGTRLESVQHIDDMIACLHSSPYDIALTTAFLQTGSTLPRLSEISDAAGEVPLIVVAGNGEEKSAANAIKRGATDYLVKSRESLELLPYLILRLLKKRRPTLQQTRLVAPTTDSVGQLLHEIDLVSRRVHNLHEPSLNEISIAALREEVKQLKRYAETLKDQKIQKFRKK
ncbi:MAG: hypothetical protein COV45_07460 [Deltaproteobacteria bacterium CG11_big_fil_rev_8_21_14_0_20_47_16]|nr:MAG: hypothetical protein COV45_07460 [Deltaproteobacteria bacterium CG11_big_fil_rev_8_21_14_0_20_47_16]